VQQWNRKKNVFEEWHLGWDQRRVTLSQRLK
jgi:hypothetical protein